MKKKLALSLASLITFTFSTQISIAESNGISLTLNGKEIKSVPVDKLGEINFKVTSGKTFKQFYSAQWGKLDNALIVFKERSISFVLMEFFFHSAELMFNCGVSGRSSRNTRSTSFIRPPRPSAP